MNQQEFQAFLVQQNLQLKELDHYLEGLSDEITTDEEGHPVIVRLPTLNSTNMARLDSITRLLADAYVSGTRSERELIRQMLTQHGPIRLHMQIDADEIRTRIDAVRFRLALIIESMKDLGPNPEDAIERLEKLCRAARNTGIDRNEILREVAALSSSIDQYGVGSMRSELLARIVVEQGIRCFACKRYYPENLPTCPHCGAANPNVPAKHAHSSGVAGSSTGPLEDDYEDSLIILPFWEAIPFMLFQAGGCVSLSVSVILVVCSCLITGFWQSWSAIGLSMLLLGIYAAIRYVQSKPSIRKYYQKNGASRMGFTMFQYFLAILLALGISIAIVWLIQAIWR